MAEALEHLTQALVDAQEWDRAGRAAGRIADPEVRVRALAASAGALVTVDLHRALAVADHAERAARSIPSLYERARGWGEIVERLTAPAALDLAADDPLHRRVRRLLAELLAGGRWLDALEPLAKVDPAALEAVDRELH